MPDARPFRCKNRTCRAEATAENGAIPKGWIAVREYPGTLEERAQTLGIFCQLSCSIEGLAQIAEAGR